MTEEDKGKALVSLRRATENLQRVAQKSGDVAGRLLDAVKRAEGVDTLTDSTKATLAGLAVGVAACAFTLPFFPWLTLPALISVSLTVPVGTAAVTSLIYKRLSPKERAREYLELLERQRGVAAQERNTARLADIDARIDEVLLSMKSRALPPRD